MLQDDPNEIERFNNLVAYAQPEQIWNVKRLINMGAYNRSYVGIQNIVDIEPLTNHVLDSSLGEKCQTYKTQDPELQKYLVQEGIVVVDGPYRSGKSSLIPEIIAGYLTVSQNIKQAELEKKLKMQNLKTYSIKDILEGDSSSDEEEVDKMNHFPWLQKGY